jgi:indole-3-glycerol phosphate synthase
MATDFLSQIIEYKQYGVQKQKRYRPLASLRRDAEQCLAHRPFTESLEAGDDATIHVIAEIKRASPSKGMIRQNLNAAEYALAYEQGGASAISVLTEDHWFKGSADDLAAARAASALPVLRKDFIVSDYQIYESAVMGADAVLLIVRILAKNQLLDYLALCAGLHLDALVEIHTPEDAAVACGTTARLIGINNRNLETFDTDTDTAAGLAGQIAPHQIPVAASGIHTSADISKNREAGIRHFLIGESIVRADDPAKFIQTLLN